VLGGFFRKGQCGARSLLALFSKLLETAVPRIDHGQLAHGKKAIQQDEK